MKELEVQKCKMVRLLWKTGGKFFKKLNTHKEKYSTWN